MQTVTEILIDFSTSMQGKIQFTKQLLLEVVIPTLDYSNRISIKTFKSDQKQLKIEEILPLCLVNGEQLTEKVRGLGIPDGNTPIAAAIRRSLASLREFPAYEKRIILLTDGEETDGGDYEMEARKAGEEGIHCEIHIIGIGLKQAELTKAQSISNYSKGTTSNIPYTSGTVYDKVVVETRLANFTTALSRQSHPTYTAPATASYNNSPQTSTAASNAPAAQPFVHQTVTAQPSDIAVPHSQSTAIESGHSDDVQVETTPNEINVEATSESTNSSGADQNIHGNIQIEVDNTKDPRSSEPDDSNLKPAHIDSQVVENADTPGEKPLPLSPFDAQVMSGVFNNVLERMEELSREFRDLKNELKKGNDGQKQQLEQLNTRTKAAMTLVDNFLSKRYRDRVESCPEPEYDQMYKVLYEDNGPVEYYVFCKILIEGAFYLSKEEWRVFLNNTKNTQAYVVMPEGEQPEYVLVDNLLDWILRGKVVPYLKYNRVVEVDTVWFSFV